MPRRRNLNISRTNGLKQKPLKIGQKRLLYWFKCWANKRYRELLQKFHQKWGARASLMQIEREKVRNLNISCANGLKQKPLKIGPKFKSWTNKRYRELLQKFNQKWGARASLMQIESEKVKNLNNSRNLR